MGNQLHVQIHQQRNPDRVLRQQICCKVLFAAIQSYPDQNQNWLLCIGTKWYDKFGITNFSSALSGWDILWLSIPSCQWSYNRPWSRDILWIQHLLTTKRLMVEWNVTHIIRATAIYWEFYGDLVPSKTMTHRHYKLFWTMSWSHRQSELICSQLRKKYKINSIRWWTRNCFQ